ncbi:ileal sodium/bile acid cotransporter [Lingula anatina]|uniref:Ileal sodium/bile acid cotransporter n=1 Tax=Lingula anatina TaxID=7574 RepID=A0A1S3K2L7_LINAN|nr:ileal sodium/bile acid cotransporter [Lingula anatina]|eukprot:XP_013416883.1 ileal sodium/bile acid cotransporter [Lingula anatina]
MVLKLMSLLVVLINFAECSLLSEINVTFPEPGVLQVYENKEATIHVTIESDRQQVVFIRFQAKDDTIAVLKGNTSTPVETWSTQGQKNLSLTVKGIFLGRTSILTTLYENQSVFENDGESLELPTNSIIEVLREPNPLYTVFLIVLSVVIGINIFGFGLMLDLEVVKEIFKKPIAPIVGFACQYIGMPLIAFAFTQILNLPDALALGLFVGGCCPGGGSSNIWSLLLDGDVNLSMCMTFISTTASIGMMPLWLFTLGMMFTSTVTIPYGNILVAIVSLLIPGFIGILVKKYAPKVAGVLTKAVRPIAAITVLVVIFLGIYNNLYVFVLFAKDWRYLVGGALVPFTGFVLSCAASFGACLPWYRVKTIMCETAIQNTGIAIVLLGFSLPQPDADLATVMAIAMSLVVPPPLVIILIIRTIYLRCCKKNQDKAKDSKENENEKKEQGDIKLETNVEKKSDLDRTENGVISQVYEKETE